MSLPQSSGGGLLAGGNQQQGICVPGVFPGAHPSSEGKRKRNRSNVEAMASKSAPDHPTNGPPNVNGKLSTYISEHVLVIDMCVCACVCF